MPLITVELVEGRSKEEKAAFAKRMVDAMQEEMGVPPASLWIVYNERPADEWFVGHDSIADIKKASS
ncbi:MAG: 4-oxalocrotonate tautomerase [Rhodospirillaceae bacterium]|jgi:4-oxalocrotonate tautomerase|nr:4-oxalocrotonate tautomerase [Rhodospirillaceae bacterium]MBT6205166.1 4-oxalocrotonate tautomerase [Rhodospirillaceae bacterium]MBT6510656.1 4-oxalocrotonate tautomerase [Rhodospirillaceae bacterium]MBT7647494.1 4-oxalocrotonate tautomerase [Rhodospirillaceae bacterium]